MKTIAVLQHQANEDAGYIAQWAENRNIELKTWPLWQQTSFKSAERFQGVIILGGDADVKNVDSLAWMQDEFDWLKQILAMGIPCYGICLGAQILATLLGARIYQLNEPERGVIRMLLNDSELLGQFSACSLQVIQAHHYRFDIPQSCNNYASSVLCEQQFFMNDQQNVLGIQCHLEWSLEKYQSLFPELPITSPLDNVSLKQARLLLYYLLDLVFERLILE